MKSGILTKEWENITNEFVAWRLETFSFYYFCGKAQHRKGGSRLNDLQHTVYYVDYLRVNKKSKDLINESDLKRLEIKHSPNAYQNNFSYHRAVLVNT